jgi:2-keto-4-pentenoate hydratase/2-oxohepta-3-ene-1,7-dioic acid hydratase in catechol pathway
MKPKSALLQPHTPFYYPEFTNELHYECELVIRISKNGKYIQEKFASKYYDAITAGIDSQQEISRTNLRQKDCHGRKLKRGIIPQ